MAAYKISFKSNAKCAWKWVPKLSNFVSVCDLEWRSRSSVLLSKCRAKWSLSSCKVWKKEASKYMGMQANVKVVLFVWSVGWLLLFVKKSKDYGFLCPILIRRDELRMRFIISTNSISNSIQIDWELCETIGAVVLDFWNPCDLEWRSESLRLVTKCRVQ